MKLLLWAMIAAAWFLAIVATALLMLSGALASTADLLGPVLGAPFAWACMLLGRTGFAIWRAAAWLRHEIGRQILARYPQEHAQKDHPAP